MSRVTELIKEIAKGNIEYLLDAISWRMPDWLFHYYRSYLLESDSPKLLSRPNDSYFKKFITEEDIPLLKRFSISETLIRERLAAGDRCIIMGKDDEIMSILWGCSSKRYMKLSGVVFDPGSDGVMLYAGFTNEEARYKGLFPTSFKELYKSYIDEGRQTIYAGIHSTNKNSLRLHHRMNFNTVGESIYFVIFGISFCYYKNWPWASRKLHVFFKRPPKGLYWI